MPRRVPEEKRCDSAVMFLTTSSMRRELERRAEADDRSIGYVVRKAIAKGLENEDQA